MMGILADQLDMQRINFDNGFVVLHRRITDSRLLGLLAQSNQLVALFLAKKHSYPLVAVASGIHPANLSVSQGCLAPPSRRNTTGRILEATAVRCNDLPL